MKRRHAHPLLGLSATLLLTVSACSGEPEPPPVDNPDGGGGTLTCEPACDPSTHVCNPETGACEPNDDFRPQMGIVNARAAGAGAADIAVDGALVTWAATGEPSASGANGFFVQWRKEGPALFVAVDPASLNPMPLPGDKVSFRITQMHKSNNTTEARAVEDWKQLSTGNDLAYLVQDVNTRADLVSNAADYDGELVSIGGRLRHDWLAIGDTGHWRSELELPSGFGDPNLVLRVNPAVSAPMGLGTNCNVTLPRAPLRRTGTQTQVFAFRTEDFSSRACPPTRLQDVLATSPTHVRLRFERAVDPASILADGSQFDFGGGLWGLHAAVQPNGTHVMVTTAVQVARQAHTVTIADTAKDILGGNLSVPSGKGDFQGYFPRAKLMLNELFCGSGRALIELVALSAGSTMGMKLTYEGSTPSETGVFPDAEVAKGDRIMVHRYTTGNHVYSETESKNQFPKADYANNYDDAWDFVFDKFTCARSNVVVRILTPDDVTQDGVALVNTGLMNNQRPAGYPQWLRALQLENDVDGTHWAPTTCNGIQCSYHSSPSALDVSADWTQARTSRSGVTSSIARNSNIDTNTREDWSISTPHTFGMKNPGQ